jgi:hypothetical protein
MLSTMMASVNRGRSRSCAGVKRGDVTDELRERGRRLRVLSFIIKCWRSMSRCLSTRSLQSRGLGAVTSVSSRARHPSIIHSSRLPTTFQSLHMVTILVLRHLHCLSCPAPLRPVRHLLRAPYRSIAAFTSVRNLSYFLLRSLEVWL